MVLDVAVDARVLAFTALSAVLTGILFGLVPALSSGRVNPGPALKDNGGDLEHDGRPTAVQNAARCHDLTPTAN
jgi:hypothetical protein